MKTKLRKENQTIFFIKQGGKYNILRSLPWLVKKCFRMTITLSRTCSLSFNKEVYVAITFFLACIFTNSNEYSGIVLLTGTS